MAISTLSLPPSLFNRVCQQPPRQVFCDLLNGLFERQSAVFDLLSCHAGQSFRLLASPVDAALTIGHDGRLAPADLAVVPDVTLTIDTAKLWSEGWRPGQTLLERVGLVHVSGDAALAQTLSTLAKSWRPDIEDLLSQYIGDVAAVQIVAGAKRLTMLAAQFFVRTSANMAEYAAHEAQWLVADARMREHTSELSSLNADLDSLQKRIEALDARTKSFGEVSANQASTGGLR